MTIKNIIFSGGGHTFYQTLGIIQTLEKNNIWKIENIEKIYGTSAGALLGAILCLKFDWETLNDYFLNRPWNDVFNVDINSILSIFNKKGFFNITQLELIFKPLLHAKDLTLNITLKELYEYSKIELHMYSFEINYFKLKEISYKTHPDLSLMTALNMTSALPIMFSPVCIDDKCYIDGGTFTNYPLSFCIEQNNKIDEILGIKNEFNGESINNTYDEDIKKNDVINNESSLLDFFISFFQKLILNFNIDNNLTYKIKHEIYCECQSITFSFLNKVMSCIETRKKLLENGIECGNQYIKKLSDNNDIDNKHETEDKYETVDKDDKDDKDEKM